MKSFTACTVCGHKAFVTPPPFSKCIDVKQCDANRHQNAKERLHMNPIADFFVDKLRRRIRENINTYRQTTDVFYKEVAKARVESYRLVLGDFLELVGKQPSADPDYSEAL